MGTARRLIITCDDLGASAAANRAILRAMTQGVATGASLMVPAPAAEAAARMTRGLPVGVHLTLTSEYPAMRWRGLTEAASLRDASGALHAGARAALAAVTAEDARAECRAQVERALGWGVAVTHLDAHMNVMQARADLFAVLLDLAAAYGLAVRMFPPGIPEDYGFDARAMAAARGIPCPDHLVYPWPRPAAEVLRESLATLPAGTTEIFAHPVEDGPELRAYDPWAPELRAADAQGLCDPALAALLDGAGIARVSYRALSPA
jgi:predicted glycoside hydrolase/deacetylase ChbG (UPF0249 family)